MTGSDLIVEDVLARLARGTPMQAWQWEVDAVHQEWLQYGVSHHNARRIRAAIEARIAGAHPA